MIVYGKKFKVTTFDLIDDLPASVEALKNGGDVVTTFVDLPSTGD